jgi:hypothetical protein
MMYCTVQYSFREDIESESIPRTHHRHRRRSLSDEDILAQSRAKNVVFGDHKMLVF